MLVNLVIGSVSVSLGGSSIIKMHVHCLQSSPESIGSRIGQLYNLPVHFEAGRSTGPGLGRPTAYPRNPRVAGRSTELWIRPTDPVQNAQFCYFACFPSFFGRFSFSRFLLSLWSSGHTILLIPTSFRVGFIISNYWWSDDNHRGLSRLVVVYLPGSYCFRFVSPVFRRRFPSYSSWR